MNKDTAIHSEQRVVPAGDGGDRMDGMVPERAIPAVGAGAECPHPLQKLFWYDGSLHCYGCATTWHRDFPEHAGKPLSWGRPAGLGAGGGDLGPAPGGNGEFRSGGEAP